MDDRYCSACDVEYDRYDRGHDACDQRVPRFDGNNGLTQYGNFGPAAEMAAAARDRGMQPAPPPDAPEITSPLPDDSAARKDIPLWTGVVQYCPAALAAAARISVKGNRKHNADGPLHHARGKSGDHSDCMARHHVDYDAFLAAYRRGDTSVTLSRLEEELGALLWRTGLFVQEELERLGLAPRAPRAVLPGENAADTVPPQGGSQK